jgi:uncharacterized membrane protein
VREREGGREEERVGEKEGEKEGERWERRAGTYNDTELEKPKKRLQFALCIVLILLQETIQETILLFLAATLPALPMIRNSRSSRNACSLFCT